MATPTEMYHSVLVKREDLFHPGFPSAKMRALVPYMTALKEQGYEHLTVPVSRDSLSPPAVVYAAQELGMKVRFFMNTTENIRIPALLYARELGEFEVAFKGRCRHWALRSAATRWAASHARTAYLPCDCADPTFYGLYAEAVAELGSDALTHVVPFLSGSFIAGIYRGLRHYGRKQDHLIAVPRRPESAGENFLARILQEAWPNKNQIKDTLPDNVIIACDSKKVPTPWPSDEETSWGAWATALRYSTGTGNRVLFWSLEQGYENRHLR